MSNFSKITLTIPQDILGKFKELVGKRKMSAWVSSVMEEKVQLEKQKEALKLARKVSSEMKKKKVSTGDKKIISAYKHERKY